MLQPKWLRKNVESWEEKEEQILHSNTKMRLIRLNTHSFDIKRCAATWSIFFKYASKEYNNAKITRMSDHFCNAGDSNLAPTAGSSKISDSKTKISGVEENLKVLTSKTKAAWERIGGWFVTHQEPGGCDCLRRSSNQPALYLPNPEIGCARDHCIDEQTRPPNTRCRTHRFL